MQYSCLRSYLWPGADLLRRMAANSTPSEQHSLPQKKALQAALRHLYGLQRPCTGLEVHSPWSPCHYTPAQKCTEHPGPAAELTHSRWLYTAAAGHATAGWDGEYWAAGKIASGWCWLPPLEAAAARLDRRRVQIAACPRLPAQQRRCFLGQFT